VPTLNWQKSTYSEEGSSCVYLAATPDDRIAIRESDEPAAILITTPATLRTLIQAIKSRA
jgi:hypothetical protein